MFVSHFFSVKPLSLTRRKLRHRFKHICHNLGVHLNLTLWWMIKLNWNKPLTFLSIRFEQLFPFHSRQWTSRPEPWHWRPHEGLTEPTYLGENNNACLRDNNAILLPRTLSVSILVHRLSSHICFNSWKIEQLCT